MVAQPSIGSQLSLAFAKVSEECTRLDAIPAFNQGVAILQAIERMQQVQQMQQQTLQQVQQQTHGLEQKIEKGFNDLKKRDSILYACFLSYS